MFADENLHAREALVVCVVRLGEIELLTLPSRKQFHNHSHTPGAPNLLITPVFPDLYRFFPRFPRDFWPRSLDSWRPDGENGRKVGKNG